MEFEWDVEKDEANRAKHGVSLAAAAALDWDEALDQIDDRTDYGELRVSALVPRAGRLYFLHTRSAARSIGSYRCGKPTPDR